MAHAPLPLAPPRRFGETMRRDAWWVQPATVFVVLGAFVVYATWAAFQNAHYAWGPYLSPFYSPEIWGASPHALLGPRPDWWPRLLPFSPALLILPIPGLFRFTCYYYRGAYYKAFWADPPSCAVGEPRKGYRGEHSFPLVLQNVHRYFLYASLLVLVFLLYDAWNSFWWPDGAGGTRFGVGVGSLVLTANVVLLASYTFGCHALRHVIGGYHDEPSRSKARHACYQGCTKLNHRHMLFAWMSLVGVAFADVYVRLVSMGVWTDWRLL